MANAEHIALVQQGAEATVRFARENPDQPLDLSGADLQGCNLTEANLAGADLSGADLRIASLMVADLTGANLCNADARGTGLHRAKLQGADLRGMQLDAIGVGRQLMCLSASNFRDVRWDRERIEEAIAILNLNRDWEIRYEIMPRTV